jgi:ribosomal RNA-processing protein 12
MNIFRSNLTKLSGLSQGSSEGTTVTMAQDLILLLVPYLESDDAEKLFTSILSLDVLILKDNGVQKRAYKTLAKIAEKSSFNIDVTQTIQKLDAFSDGLMSAAKKDRFSFLDALVPSIPSEHLHLIVSLIPEVVLGTKEPSDKTRSAAFKLLVTLGKRMRAGGVVRRSEIDGMDEDGEQCKFGKSIQD